MQRKHQTHTLIAAIVIVACAAWSRPAIAQPVRDHDIVPEDYFNIWVITGCAVSPDGKYVAFTESRWDKAIDKRNTDLWVVECPTNKLRRLTFDKASDSSPKWSPDGRYIYFTSNRKRGEEKDPPYNGKKQVWRITPDGGELLAVTRLEDGIGLFDLSKAGQTLYYTTDNEQVDDEWADLRKKYKDLEYGHGVTKFSQLWKLDLVNWRAEKLLDEKHVIRELTVSPDETRIAMITTPDEEIIINEGWSRVDVYDVATKEISTKTDDTWRADHPSPYGWVSGPSWSADGQALAFQIDYDGYPGEIYVQEWAGEEVTLRKLRRPETVTLTGHLHWRGKSRTLCFLGEERARCRVYGIDDVSGNAQGEWRTLTEGDIVATTFGFSESGGKLAVVWSTTKHPRDLFLVSRPDKHERLTRVNPHVDTWKLPQISLVTWTGANGDEVEGILELPPDYKPGDGPLPMVVELHGGPTAATMYRLRLWIYGRALMPSKGYALLSPNYHGSTGYGDKFMTDLIGNENSIEVKDILAGVDAMIERGIADPDRLGVMGWSNGGFLTNSVISQSDRFKAASSGAGVLDMVIQWGTEDTPGHVINYMQGLPWANPEAYWKGSPIYDLANVKTPTLIHVGGSDPRVPPAHSRALYRALYHYLKVPTELVVYPNEGHGLSTYQNRLAKMEWDLAWFDKYLLGKDKDEEGESQEEETPGK